MNCLEYYRDLEAPVAQCFFDMQIRGIKIDLNYLNELKDHLEAQFVPLEEEIKNKLGIENVNSDKQVIQALDQRYGLNFVLKGRPSRSKVVLERMRGNHIVDLLLAHSELSTLLDSFIYPYLERNTDTANPFFNQCGTRTGRPSCSNPNLLQIPKRGANGKLVRDMFVAREGHEYGEFDYKNGEPRIWGHLSKDPFLLEMFNKGIDFHTHTSEKMNIDRDKAKILNLSVGYLATFKSVSQQLRCTESEAQKEIDQWWGLYPGLKNWQDKLIWQTKKDGYFTTLLGRRIKVEGLNEYNKWKREFAQRQLANNIAQSSLGEVIKLAMISIRKFSIPMLVQVYDSLLVEPLLSKSEQSFKIVRDCMFNAIKLDVPLEIEFKRGFKWGSLS